MTEPARASWLDHPDQPPVLLDDAQLQVLTAAATVLEDLVHDTGDRMDTIAYADGDHGGTLYVPSAVHALRAIARSQAPEPEPCIDPMVQHEVRAIATELDRLRRRLTVLLPEEPF